MKNISLLISGAIAFITLVLTMYLPGCRRHNDSPNIIFILTDDLGYYDLSCNGNRIFETPNIDALANMGVAFENAYSSPLCTPTRAALMTGKYPGRLKMTRVGFEYDRGETNEPGVYHPATRQKPEDLWDELSVPIRTNLPHEEITLAEVAKTKGYKTGFIGKWHLGFNEFYPENQGFDYCFGGDHWSDYFAPWEGERTKDHPSSPGEHIGDRLAEEAVNFIERNKDDKFMLCLWTYGVHAPIQGKKELVRKYTGKLNNSEQYSPVYGAMVETVDQTIGQVLKSLKKNNLMENTLIVFMSDNGAVKQMPFGKIYDPRYDVNNNTANTEVELWDKKQLIQEFNCELDTFNLGFSISKVNHNKKRSLLKAEIYDNKSVIKLAEEQFKLETLKPGDWIYLKGVNVQKDSNFQLKLSLVNAEKGTFVGFNSTEDNSIPNLSLFENEEELEGDLCIRLIDEHTPLRRNVKLTDLKNLRGAKITVYEGGIKTPLYFVWPGVIAEGKAIESVVAHIDILPTISDFMGAKVNHPIDGLSLHDLILNSKPIAKREIYWHYPHYMFSHGAEVIRDDRYKYIELYKDESKELYDLIVDPEEKNNLINEKPEKAEELMEKLHKWLKQIDAAMPTRDS